MHFVKYMGDGESENFLLFPNNNLKKTLDEETEIFSGKCTFLMLNKNSNSWP